MADEENCSFVLLKCSLKLILRIHIQMVRRLVEKKNIRLTVHKLTEADLRLLTTGENTNLTLDILCSQAALCKGRADFVLGVGRKLLPDLLETGRRISRCHLLREVTRELIVTDLNGSGDRRDQPLNAL